MTKVRKEKKRREGSINLKVRVRATDEGLNQILRVSRESRKTVFGSEYGQRTKG
jgi:hypothetical protein